MSNGELPLHDGSLTEPSRIESQVIWKLSDYFFVYQEKKQFAVIVNVVAYQDYITFTLPYRLEQVFYASGKGRGYELLSAV